MEATAKGLRGKSEDTSPLTLEAAIERIGHLEGMVAVMLRLLSQQYVKR